MKNLYTRAGLAPGLFALGLGLAGLIPHQTQAQTQPRLMFSPFATGIAQPVDLTTAPGDAAHLFAVERGGRIRVLDTAGTVTTTPFLDLTARVTAAGQEQGLLGLAFHPGYASNGYFFVYYTNTQGATQLSRFSVGATPMVADAASEVPLFSFPQPFANHNGGCIKFGPDGYLYVALGDGGSGGDPGNRSQNLNNPLGKILRLDVDTTTATTAYGIPPDNPLVGQPNTRPEIWAWGVRNPWRFSFDRATGDFWAGDVGQGAWEEVNVVPAIDTLTTPRNFGWRCYEGTHAYNIVGCGADSTYRKPVFEYPHSIGTGGFSITGGFVYRGQRYSNLRGRYVFADYVSGHVWTTSPADSGQAPGYYTRIDNTLSRTGITAFGEDSQGELYCTLLTQGTILRLRAVGGSPLNPGTPLAVPARLPEAAALAVWPNPASGGCRISGAAPGETVEVISLVTGQAVRRAVADHLGSATLDVRGLPAALYGVRTASRAGARARLTRLVVNDSH